MKGYGKKRYPDDCCHKLWYLTLHDDNKSLAVYRTFTPFSKRRLRLLTTNKAAARRANKRVLSEYYD